MTICKLRWVRVSKPSSDVRNEVIVSSPKLCLFPAATDILYSMLCME